MPDATSAAEFACPDLTTFCGLDDLGLEVTGQRLEEIPLPDAAVDVVISNCVFTLSTDSPARWPRRLVCCVAVAGSGSVTFWPNPTWTRPAAPRPNTRLAARWAPLTAEEYRDHLPAAGFATATIIPTHTLAEGLSSAVQATTPR